MRGTTASVSKSGLVTGTKLEVAWWREC